MDYILYLVDFIIHIDVHLDSIITNYGAWTYAILFTIVFCETGLVVTPFLPGDSLLFAAGVFCARGSLNLLNTVVLLTLAAIIGDAVNYAVGAKIGPKVFEYKDSKIFRRSYLERTQQFFEKYGGKAIIFARFVPIVRTFAPFLAGVGKMTYARFGLFNITGAIAWNLLFVVGGYMFGDREIVRKNFTLVIFAIIIISILPAIFEVVRARKAARHLGSSALP